ncbi:biliverdin-producing heme oxygenase [Variovorax sp. VNK109]|jgi:heme oxygenase|uniref:biliverdin-producing heme oxygenase n=1 Tax=Variovorax sp. VNK109 TaxID=3400919 RepID=UPI003BFC3C88
MSTAPTDTSPPASAGVLHALRTATSAQHEWLDSHVPLAKTSPGRADYVMHLQALALWLRRIQPALELAGWGQEYLAAALEDLQEAGVDPDMAVTAVAGASTAALPDRNPAFCHGVAYVVEGSQLGGQVLYKRLAASLAPLSLAYLQGRGPETGAHWRSFLEALKAHADTPQDIALACDGARWAFATIIELHRSKERLSPT